METVVAALIIIALVLFGMLTLAHGYLSAQDQILESWQAMEARVGEQSRTSLLPVRAEALGVGDVVEITVRNDGHTKLADYQQWDVILQYDAASSRVTEWCPYAGAAEPAPNQWTVTGIYLDAQRDIAEVYEPGILNPGEEMVIRARISPPVMEGTTNVASIATPNGITASTVFTR